MIQEYYLKQEDEFGNIKFDKIDINKEFTLQGRTIEEIITILNGLELERITNIKMTMNHLQEYIELIKEEQEKCFQEAITRSFKNMNLFEEDKFNENKN